MQKINNINYLYYIFPKAFLPPNSLEKIDLFGSWTWSCFRIHSSNTGNLPLSWASLIQEKQRNDRRVAVESKQSLPQNFEESEREVLVTSLLRYHFPSGIAAVLAFHLVDIMLNPPGKLEILLWRLASIPVVGLCYLAYRFDFFRKKFYSAPALFATFYLGILQAIVTQKTGREASPHILGLVIITTDMCHFAWRPKILPFFYFFAWAPFWAALYFSPAGSLNLPVVAVDFIFFLGTLGVATSSFGSAFRLRRSGFQNRQALEQTTLRQAEVIDQKTKEGIFLERLASQFSPQVIASIKCGTLDLDSRVRRPVTCIFVDVQNSTNRIGRIDHHNYTNLIAVFFDDCVKIFLKHNVTVGTFLGDGILAFTNAPTENQDFQKNALAACLEILSTLERKKKSYFAAWRNEFNIRIGVETGYATVGFFPSRQHGTYTALGETVSLAARLCSRATPNSIAVTKQFLTTIDLSDNSLQIEKLAMMDDMKGLEGESFEVFGVRPPPQPIANEDFCPSCVVQMNKESSQIGAIILRCPNCGYRELLAVEKSATAKHRAAG